MCRKMKKFEKDFHISFFNLTQFFLAFELNLVIFLFTFLISCLFTIFQGDSGGPLMVKQSDGRWVLAGTVSHGIKCAYPDMPGVYMRMTYYKPWIEKVTGLKL